MSCMIFYDSCKFITVQHIPCVIILEIILLKTARTHFSNTTKSHRNVGVDTDHRQLFFTIDQVCFEKTADCRKARPTILSGKVHGEPWILDKRTTAFRVPESIRTLFFKDERVARKKNT